MEFIVLILLALVSMANCSCDKYIDCHTCVSASYSSVKCKWCYKTNSCHSAESSKHTCKECIHSLISKDCFVNSTHKCDRYNVNGLKGEQFEPYFKSGQFGPYFKTEQIGPYLKSGQFEPNEAVNATLYSAIANSDDPVKCANKIIEAGQIEIVEVIGRKCNYIFKYKECLAITAVSHSLKKIILAYRGTTSNEQLVDEIESVISKPKVPAKIGGCIQEYFSNANDQLYPCAKSSMKDLVNKYPTFGVIIAGHSLGAAIASIASAQLVFDNVINKENTTLYTFGLPRTGDRKYAFNHDKLIKKSWRVVHFRDIVPKLPPMTPFPDSPYHHQREIFYGENMGILSNYIECFNYEDKNCSRGYLPSLSSIEYHRVYYGINVEFYCDDMMYKRRKRPDADSDISHLFTNTTCKRIRAADIVTRGAAASMYGVV